MCLSWNEIRARAARFAEEWAEQGYEKGQTQLFYRDFFSSTGFSRRTGYPFIMFYFDGACCHLILVYDQVARTDVCQRSAKPFGHQFHAIAAQWTAFLLAEKSMVTAKAERFLVGKPCWGGGGARLKLHHRPPEVLSFQD